MAELVGDALGSAPADAPGTAPQTVPVAAVPTVVDQRVKLFSFATADNPRRYLEILRVFDAARQQYQSQLDVAAVLSALGDETIDEDGLRYALDKLHSDGVLDRTQDSARVKTIAEYRRRRSLYQFTDLGFLAFEAVDGIVRSKPTEIELQKLAFPAILEDLKELATAAKARDAARVNILLQRLHDVLTSMTRRVARFRLMLGDLSKVQETRAEVFLQHKDVLLNHLHEFLVELQRHRPMIGKAVSDVLAVGDGVVVELAASVDTRPFATDEEKRSIWANHLRGIVEWFIGSTKRSQAEELDRQTTFAIAQLLSLLRRVTESRRGGFSRDAQLVFLARWFLALETDRAAHALFAATFGLRSARHFSIAHPDATLPPSKSWWEAKPVDVAMTLREHGRDAQPRRPAKLADKSAERAAAQAEQKAKREAEAAAELSLLKRGAFGRVLTRDELNAFLRLLDLALQTRTTVVGALPVKPGALLGDGQNQRLRLRIRHARGSAMTVHSVDGTLSVRDVVIELEARAPSRSRTPAVTQ